MCDINCFAYSGHVSLRIRLFVHSRNPTHTLRGFPYTCFHAAQLTMAVPSDKERLTRLETRAREADNALKQLKSYVKLLKSRAGPPQLAK